VASTLVEMETMPLPLMEVSSLILAVNCPYDRKKGCFNRYTDSSGIKKTHFNVISRLQRYHRIHSTAVNHSQSCGHLQSLAVTSQQSLRIRVFELKRAEAVIIIKEIMPFLAFVGIAVTRLLIASQFHRVNAVITFGEGLR